MEHKSCLHQSPGCRGLRDFLPFLSRHPQEYPLAALAVLPCHCNFPTTVPLHEREDEQLCVPRSAGVREEFESSAGPQLLHRVYQTQVQGRPAPHPTPAAPDALPVTAHSHPEVLQPARESVQARGQGAEAGLAGMTRPRDPGGQHREGPAAGWLWRPSSPALTLSTLGVSSCKGGRETGEKTSELGVGDLRCFSQTSSQILCSPGQVISPFWASVSPSVKGSCGCWPSSSRILQIYNFLSLFLHLTHPFYFHLSPCDWNPHLMFISSSTSSGAPGGDGDGDDIAMVVMMVVTVLMVVVVIKRL